MKRSDHVGRDMIEKHEPTDSETKLIKNDEKLGNNGILLLNLLTKSSVVQKWHFKSEN